MKDNNSRLYKRVGIGMLTALMAIALNLPAHLQANSLPFAHLYAFGDSLTDTGNFYEISGGSPAAPYFEGRYCNGPVWVEYLAQNLGMPFQKADDYAVVGATTGVLNYKDSFAGKEYPGLLEQIASFRAAGPLNQPERALFVVAAGPNDFLVGMGLGMAPADIIANGVSNEVVAIQQLWAMGARHILVMNVPDLGVTPYAKSIGMAQGLTQLAGLYNHYLNAALDQLAQAGIQTIRLDAFALLDAMAYQPAEYGFNNVTVPAMAVGSTSNEYLFWDGFHPTTRAHEIFAELAVDELLNFFSPRNGRGTPASRVNALHGLVNQSN